MTKVMFWVQHLLGIGHLKRAATLSLALSKAGFDVHLVSGGGPVQELRLEGLTLHQLPHVRAVDVFFKDLRNSDDLPIDDEWRDRRKQATLNLFNDLAPDALLTELFPFGRRQFRFEMEPLLSLARSQGVYVACSVRDILVENPKPERTLEMLERVERFYDRVFVHGDPDFVPFGETFPQASHIAEKLGYTGYVAEPVIESTTNDGHGEVIVSAGGGAVSEDLLKAAILARPLTAAAADMRWRVLCGANVPQSLIDELQSQAGSNVIVERGRKDFPSLLGRAALSISQAGYNTIIDILQAKIPSVVVPYAGGLESEQTLRAGRLAEMGIVQMVKEDELSPEALARAIDRALQQALPGIQAVRTNGGPETARLLASDLEKHR